MVDTHTLSDVIEIHLKLEDRHDFNRLVGRTYPTSIVIPFLTYLKDEDLDTVNNLGLYGHILEGIFERKDKDEIIPFLRTDVEYADAIRDICYVQIYGPDYADTDLNEEQIAEWREFRRQIVEGMDTGRDREIIEGIRYDYESWLG